VILVHGQFIRMDQVQALKSLGIFPSMFPMHTFYWGDWYKQIVGPEQAARISPMRSILNTGLHARATPTRRLRCQPDAGRVGHRESHLALRDDHRPRRARHALRAMKMITIWSAEQFGEQATKGSLEEGKLADLVVLSDNPLTVEPATINQIQVLETIKEGRTVWSRSEGRPGTAREPD